MYAFAFALFKLLTSDSCKGASPVGTTPGIVDGLLLGTEFVVRVVETLADVEAAIWEAGCVKPLEKEVFANDCEREGTVPRVVDCTKVPSC